MPYSQKLKRTMESVQASGFPIFMMLNLYKKSSKLKPEIPEPVVNGICMEYFKRQGKIDKSFPYFLEVLKRETHRYFSAQSQAEGLRHKSEPLWLGDILKNV